jgi:hypothetical protein
MKRCVYFFCGLWVVFLFSACAGPGERIPVTFSYTDESPASKTGPPQQKVVVFPFEDKRDDPKMIGRHIHLWGQVDTYMPKTSVGDNISRLLVVSLKHRGWDARLAPAGVPLKDIKTDLVVTGTVRSLRAEAISRIGYTKIDARFGLDADILNPKTSGKTTLSIVEQNDPKVVFFHSDSIQEILNDLISSGLNRIDLSGSQTH